jgi:hypothetical protein
MERGILIDGRAEYHGVLARVRFKVPPKIIECLQNKHSGPERGPQRFCPGRIRFDDDAHDWLLMIGRRS